METNEQCKTKAIIKIEQNLLECKKSGVLIVTSNSKEFIDALFAAIHFEVPIFLGNPKWKENEWAQVFKQVQPAIIFGETPNISINSGCNVSDLNNFQKYIMIPTGGTSGKLRFAMHTWESLSSSAKGTAEFLEKNIINSLCLLPLYHVSGLMQIIRAHITQGTVLFDGLETFNAHHDFKGFCLSLVPTQLERFMENKKILKILKTFDIIFLGGAAATEHLLAKARAEKLPIAPTYGMTETGSMIAAMMPEYFLNGKKGVGSALPHAQISVNEEKRIMIQSESLFSGYFPELPQKKNVLITDDEGIIKDGQLIVIGRADNIIITGGEKVNPKEVEEAILATGLVKSVAVKPKKDQEWGERITAIYVPIEDINHEELIEKIRLMLKHVLLNYKIPKEWIAVKELPIDEKGKWIFEF